MTEEPQMDETLWTGKYLQVRQRDHWQFVTRPNATAVVGVIALTDYQQIVLVEQYRRPLGTSAIELPAGLVGDEPGSGDEDTLVAAQRELEEETGFVAEFWEELVRGPSSAGLTDEQVTLYLATGAQQQSRGGGVAGEEITVHTVPLASAAAWLREQAARGLAIDLKVYAALYFASAHFSG
jgi:ADP-ribose pyrophosphatase